MGNELGAKSNYTNKQGEGERAIVNGHHETSTFQDLLDGFIAKYVCCINCRLPEIDMALKKEKGETVIKGRCLACGWQGLLDNNDKLAAFILKSPPDSSGVNIVVAGDKDAKAGKAARQEAKKAKQQNKGEDAEDDDDEADADSDADSDVDAKKEKKEKKEKKDKKDKNDSDDDDSDADGEKKEKKE